MAPEAGKTSHLPELVHTSNVQRNAARASSAVTAIELRQVRLNNHPVSCRDPEQGNYQMMDNHQEPTYKYLHLLLPVNVSDKPTTLGRRIFLYSTASAATGLVISSSAMARVDSIRLRFDRSDAGSWHLVGSDDTLTARRSDNAPLHLRRRQRYIVVNDAWPEHPFQLVDEDGDVLLSQAGGGRLDENGGLSVHRWEDYPERMSFTITDELAAVVDRYRSGADRSMQGDVVVIGAGERPEDEDGRADGREDDGEDADEDGREEEGREDDRQDREERSRDDDADEDRRRDDEHRPDDPGEDRRRDDERQPEDPGEDRGRGDEERGPPDDDPAEDRRQDGDTPAEDRRRDDEDPAEGPEDDRGRDDDVPGDREAEDGASDGGGEEAAGDVGDGAAEDGAGPDREAGGEETADDPDDGPGSETGDDDDSPADAGPSEDPGASGNESQGDQGQSGATPGVLVDVIRALLR